MSESADKQSGFYARLVERYVEGSATEEELEIFFHLLREGKLDMPLMAVMNNASGIGSAEPQDEALAADWPRIPLPAASRVRRLHKLARFAVAAVLLLLLGTGAWWIFIRQPASAPPAPLLSRTDVPAPAANRARITLWNGQQVYLDSVGNGALAQQGNAQLVKLANGQVVYKAERVTSREMIYNTLTNPRGSQIVTLTLADGTRVWLNAESSLRYPVVFNGIDRIVEVTGEAYFEVAQDAKNSFKVKKGSTTIEVLGTAFNVNSYTDEPALRVTLLNGKVRVASGQQEAILYPGQQAQVTTTIKTAGDIDLETVMAWKNGNFAFHDADLPTVLRQLARWYNVDVLYQGPAPEGHFNGRIGKSLTLDQVLHLLARARVHYSIEKKNQLIIRP